VFYRHSACSDSVLLSFSTLRACSIVIQHAPSVFYCHSACSDGVLSSFALFGEDPGVLPRPPLLDLCGMASPSVGPTLLVCFFSSSPLMLSRVHSSVDFSGVVFSFPLPVLFGVLLLLPDSPAWFPRSSWPSRCAPLASFLDSLVCWFCSCECWTPW
jgi:hypothetical protein